MDAHLHHDGAAHLTQFGDAAVQQMVATGLIGALTALFTTYLAGHLQVSRAQFIDFCVDMLLSTQAQREDDADRR